MLVVSLRAPSSTYPPADVKALGRQLGMSQAKFAANFGLGLDAGQSWEQARRRPEGAARVLLKVIQHDPDVVRRALAA